MSNHLGNVLTTISDKKAEVQSNVDTNLVDHFDAVVVNAFDYYAFGMIMPDRKFQGLNYKFGFNGKENDNEVKGFGNEQDYGMRIYDPRIGRFLSIDPISKKFPELTPYQFASNRPIDGIDIDGLEYATFHIYVDKNQKVTKITHVTDYELKKNGTEGPGIKYIIYRVDEGNRPDEVKFVKNYHGIYQGPNNPQLPRIGGNYKDIVDDYRLAPIDETDANAKQHDLDYDIKNISGFPGVMDDRSTKANEAYIKRAEITIEKQKTGGKDEITGKPVTQKTADAAKFGKKGFNIAEYIKKFKLERGPKL